MDKNLKEKFYMGLESKKLKIFIIFIIMLPTMIIILSKLNIDIDVIKKYIEYFTYSVVAYILGQTGIDVFEKFSKKKESNENNNVGSM